MSKFIKLNEYRGKEFTINVNHIVAYCSGVSPALDDNTIITKIETTKEPILVEETTDEIDKKIESINKIA